MSPAAASQLPAADPGGVRRPNSQHAQLVSHVHMLTHIQSADVSALQGRKHANIC